MTKHIVVEIHSDTGHGVNEVGRWRWNIKAVLPFSQYGEGEILAEGLAQNGAQAAMIIARWMEENMHLIGDQRRGKKK